MYLAPFPKPWSTLSLVSQLRTPGWHTIQPVPSTCKPIQSEQPQYAAPLSIGVMQVQETALSGLLINSLASNSAPAPATHLDARLALSTVMVPTNTNRSLARQHLHDEMPLVQAEAFQGPEATYPTQCLV